MVYANIRPTHNETNFTKIKLGGKPPNLPQSQVLAYGHSTVV